MISCTAILAIGCDAETDQEPATETSFIDLTVESLMEEKEKEGCLVEIIDANYIGAGSYGFEEGFKATGKTVKGEFICAKFKDTHEAYLFYDDVLVDGRETGSVDFNNTMTFYIEDLFEGTIDHKGVICYYPEMLNAPDLVWTPDNYQNSDIKSLCQKYIDEGYLLKDAGTPMGEGFLACTVVEDEDYLQTSSITSRMFGVTDYANLKDDNLIPVFGCAKYEDADWARNDFVYDICDSDVDFSRNSDGAFYFSAETETAYISGFTTADGLVTVDFEAK